LYGNPRNQPTSMISSGASSASTLSNISIPEPRKVVVVGIGIGPVSTCWSARNPSRTFRQATPSLRPRANAYRCADVAPTRDYRRKSIGYAAPVMSSAFPAIAEQNHNCVTTIQHPGEDSPLAMAAFRYSITTSRTASRDLYCCIAGFIVSIASINLRPAPSSLATSRSFVR